jgi:hypothetical protein
VGIDGCLVKKILSHVRTVVVHIGIKRGEKGKMGKIIILRNKRVIRSSNKILPSGKLMMVMRRDNTMTNLLKRVLK